MCGNGHAGCQHAGRFTASNAHIEWNKEDDSDDDQDQDDYDDEDEVEVEGRGLANA